VVRYGAFGDLLMTASIFPELKKAGFTLPPDCLYHPGFAGLSADAIYARLKDGENPQAGKGQGQGGDKPLSTGEVKDAPPQPGEGEGQAEGDGQDGDGEGKTAKAKPRDMTPEDWKIAAEQSAATAKGAGKDPGSAAELARAARAGREDWRELLAEFMTAAKDPSDYSWMRPNRRHIHEGLYLPGVTKESCGEIVIAVDTSGSMSQRDLAAIAAEVQSIAGECKPERLTVIYCDTRIRGVVEIEPEADITLEAQGRGGTAFAPVFEHLSRAEEPPQCLIYATDLDGPMVEDPGYPVLWITPEKVTDVAPFGRTVRMPA
jgi:predicted metal-dependent peptidase